MHLDAAARQASVQFEIVARHPFRREVVSSVVAAGILRDAVHIGDSVGHLARIVHQKPRLAVLDEFRQCT